VHGFSQLSAAGGGTVFGLFKEMQKLPLMPEGPQWLTAQSFTKDKQRRLPMLEVTTCNAPNSVGDKGQQWLTTLGLVKEMKQWCIKADVIT